MENTKTRTYNMFYIAFAIVVLFFINVIGCMNACNEPKPQLTTIKK